ncbi:MAG TPA: TIGR02302 family protein [Stellaceae bacterium]|nr:TIGR02302 family protein [Stellaceae bacterium]
MNQDAAPDRLLGRRMFWSRAALAWEFLWPALWPPLGIAGLFVVFALFDLPNLLPSAVHAAILAGFAAAFAGAAWWGSRKLVWPDALAGRRRIERESGLAHRPLAALADHPSAPLDDASAALWEAHRRRMAAAMRRLRVGWPVAGLARRDPWGLRAILVILLVVAVIDAGPDWRERLARAFAPGWESGPPAPSASFDIWITPPDYTGLPPQFLRADMSNSPGGPVRVPTGSTLLAQIHGGHGVPSLSIDGNSSDFEALDKQNYRASATLSKGEKLSVTQAGATLGSWPIEIIPDNPPTAAFVEPPRATIRAALRIEYKATDDYGVEAAKLVIRREGGKPEDKLEIALPLPGLHLKEAKATNYQDLSPHPWAGLPVEITVVATDALGQTGESEPVRMNLPERTFTNPVARAIIEQRRELVKDPNSRDAVAEILDDLDKQPSLFHDDTVAYLALRLAALRLRQDDAEAAVAAVVPLLWETALRIEDGRMAVAEQELRRLQQQLQDALALGASDEEIDKLTRELSDALNRYLQALAQDMRNRPADENQRPADPSKVVTSRDLQRMLDRARQLAHSGAQQQARELLSQLQDMLENLRTARPSQGQQGAGEAEQMMRGLRDMMQRQQQLLDRSFRAQRGQGQRQGRGQQPGQMGQMGQGQMGQGQMGQPGDDQDGSQMGDLGDSAAQQEELRRALGEIMRHMGDGNGDIPDPLGRAERAMRDAAGALQRGAPGDAIGPQSQALDELQQGARDFAKQMQEQMSKGWGSPGDDDGSAGDMPGKSDLDPFGRPLSSNGSFDQGDVTIPDASILQKSRQILDELRRRAGERSRPAIELDYIDRLLRRF